MMPGMHLRDPSFTNISWTLHGCQRTELTSVEHPQAFRKSTQRFLKTFPGLFHTQKFQIKKNAKQFFLGQISPLELPSMSPHAPPYSLLAGAALTALVVVKRGGVASKSQNVCAPPYWSPPPCTGGITSLKASVGKAAMEVRRFG